MIKFEDIRYSSSSIDDAFTATPRSSRTASAGAGRLRIASASDLSGFARVAHDKLVHLSKMDFWKLAQDEEGNYYIERLVEDDSSPIKG